MCNDPKPTAEHAFLKQMVGQWTYESECVMSPGQPVMKTKGTETIRSLGDFWVIGEGTGDMPDGSPGHMVITLGYDPAQKRYVGTWIGSMMPRLWVYDVTVDGNTINMESDGPAFDDPTKTARYRDAIEIRSPDHRVFTASLLNPDGSKMTFMTAHYQRVK